MLRVEVEYFRVATRIKNVGRLRDELSKTPEDFAGIRVLNIQFDTVASIEKC
jgi:hypothetical protein